MSSDFGEYERAPKQIIELSFHLHPAGFHYNSKLGIVETRLIIDGEEVITPVATDGGTGETFIATTPDDALLITEVNADAEGDDREHLNDEYVVFRNNGDKPLDLSG